ncbi:MAG: glycerophosphodiester phosphodiesterase [Proteobacteria bacterium]|nr:glycerophosphodiester phosphodiesterase [Pseudomonadota bacterium]MBU1648613.1 glycerophosphodiester phosphodiesterase [Pseudomonadota bacterium]
MAVFAQAGDKIVIAHRAASGYLMEHNLPSVTLAVAMGSDYIEQDLVMTKDDQVIVLHEPTLDRVTNVAELFPGRERKDDKFYAIDFTLAEIKQLHLKEPYPNSGRFPDTNKNLQLTVPTFQEELELIRGLEKTLRKDIGIYPEIKQPWFHRKEGKDISMAVVKILREYGYKSQEDKIFLQCFDPDELRRIHDELFPVLQMNLKLIQLIDDNNGNETKSLQWGEWINYNYDWITSKSGLRTLSAYVAGIGMDKSMLVDKAGNLLLPELVSDAHSLGMVVHPYTFRREKESVPPYVATFEELLEFFYFKVGVDGVFTDYCGDAVTFLQKRAPGSVNEPAVEGEGREMLPAQPTVAPELPQSPEMSQTVPVDGPGVTPVAAPLVQAAPVPEPPVPASTPESSQVPSPSSVSPPGPGMVPIPAPVFVPEPLIPATSLPIEVKSQK